MAHNLKVEAVPHANKDGTPSKTRKDYRLIDRHRGKRILVGVFTSQAKAEEAKQPYHDLCAANHATRMSSHRKG